MGTATNSLAGQANLRSALAAGTISVSDGTTTISVDLAFVQSSNNNGAITAGNLTQAQAATALTAAAANSAAFTIGTFTANLTTGFDITEKAGKGGANDTISYLGHADLVNEADTTVANGVTKTGTGAMGANISDFATAGTGDDVDTE